LLVGVLRHPPTTFPLQSVLTQAVYLQATRNSHRHSTICCMCKTVSSWRWALGARNM